MGAKRINVVHREPKVVKQCNNFQLTFVCRPIHCRVVMLIEDCRICSLFHKKSSNICLAVLSGNEEGSTALIINAIDTNALLKKKAYYIKSSLGARPVNRLHADVVNGSVKYRRALTCKNVKTDVWVESSECTEC